MTPIAESPTRGATVKSGSQESKRITGSVHRDEVRAVNPLPASQPLALASLAMSALLAALGTSVANVALPSIAQAFTATFAAVQWVVIAYLLAITTLIVGAGRLGDIVGRRSLLLVGISLFMAASFACAFAPLLPALIVARAVQGAGAAIMMALTMAMVNDTVPRSRTATALGLLGTMSAIGTALGPSLGGLLISAFGWRSLFLLLVPLGAATLAGAYRYLPPDDIAARQAADNFDFPGTTLLAFTLGTYALAMTGSGDRSAVHALGWLTLSAVSATFFVRAQLRAAFPLVSFDALRDVGLFPRLATNALVTTVMMSTLVVGPFYLVQSLGLTAAQTGLAMSAGPLVAALAGVPAGRLADRFSTGIMTLVGLSTMLTGTVLLSLAPLLPGIPGYIGPMVLLTAGYALFQTANNAAVMAGSNSLNRGAIAGLLNLSRNLGLVTGASVMGAVFNVGKRIASVASSPTVAASIGMRTTFALAALLLVIAVTVAVVQRMPVVVAANRSAS